MKFPQEKFDTEVDSIVNFNRRTDYSFAKGFAVWGWKQHKKKFIELLDARRFENEEKIATKEFPVLQEKLKTEEDFINWLESELA